MSTRITAKKLSETILVCSKEEQELPQPKLLSESEDSQSEYDDGDGNDNADSNNNVSNKSGGSGVGSGSIINDLSTFEAVAEDIRAVLSTKGGSISVTDIAKIIDRSNNVVSLTRQHFPAAIGSSELLSKVMKTLEDTYNVTSNNTLLTHSVCPDEINHWDGHVIDLFVKTLGGGRAFELGGLAGIPFSGKTGFAAFSHHIPDGGNAFVFQAAHIGISNSLKLGQYSRVGQHHDGSACGAAVGALAHCCAAAAADNTNLADNNASCDDYQMNYIIHEISKCMECIHDSYVESGNDENARQAALAKQTHRIGKEMLDKIVSTDFGCDESMLFVLTGIQINMPFGFEDYFEPISFEMRKSDGTVVDLYKQTFKVA